MRALAMTGMVTASWMPLMRIGSDMRATPPSRRMSAGTRSSAMTAAAPASSAIFACSASTTSMMTPPLSISARPALTRKVDSSRITPQMVATGKTPVRTELLQAERPDAVVVLRRVAGVDPVGERLQDREQADVRAHEGRRVRRVVERALRELGDLGERRVDDRERRRLPVAGDLHRAHDQRMRAAGAEADDQRVDVDAPEPRERLLGRRRRDL